MVKSKKNNKEFIFKLVGMPFSIALIISLFIFTYFLPFDFLSGIITFIFLFFATFIPYEVIVLKDKSEYKFHIEIMISIFIALVLLAQLFVLNGQLNIFEKQTRILEESSISNRPEVIIWSSQGLIRDGNDPLAKGGEEEIGIGVTNLGKVKIPQIRIESATKSMFSTKMRDKKTIPWVINDLEPLSYNTTFLKYKIKYNYFEDFEFGKTYELKFKITCPICKETVDYKNIEICLFEENVRDCGDEWV